MTTENLKSALEYAVELNEHGLEILTAADGTEYYDANKFNLKELDPKRYPKTLELSTLTSLVDYLKTDLNNLKNQRLIVAVEKNDEVCVWSENDEIEHRTLLVDVNLLAVSYHRNSSISCCNQTLLTITIVAHC